MPRPRTFDEADVVAAARDAFWSHGYAATSVDDLTAATGLGKGSLYGAFGNKHTLFLRALDGYLDTALDSVHAQLRDPKHPPYERLARHIRAQAAVVAADKGRRGCLMAKSAAELGATDAEVSEKVQRTLAAWRSELVDNIKAGQRNGSIDPGANAQALGTALLALMRGFEVLGKGGVKPAEIRAAGDEAVNLIPTG